jgi:2-iminobutanoate/2-iminopropanoate deaminase
VYADLEEAQKIKNRDSQERLPDRSENGCGGFMSKLLITRWLLVSLCAGVTLAADKKVILPKGAEPNAGWSYGVEVDGTLYVSGMAGEDAAGKIPGSFEAEMKQAFDNIGAVLKDAGMSPADVVSVQVYLTDGALFDRMNTVYKAYFKGPKPARTTVVVSKLVGPGHVEITVTAKK